MKKIAHRSGPTVFPEQTVASAKQALADGAEMIEIDTRFTADGQIAVCHDSNALRVFGIDKAIDEMTAAEFTALRHKDAPDYTAHLLTDYLDAGIAPLLLHVKVGGEKLIPLLDTLRAADYLGKVTLGVTTTEDIRIVKAYDPAISVLAFMGRAEYIDESAEAGADYIRLWEKWVTPERVERILSHGKKVWIMANYWDGEKEIGGYTTEENLRLWASMQVDGVLMNDIRYMQNI